MKNLTIHTRVVGIKISITMKKNINLIIIFLLVSFYSQLNAQKADSKKSCTDFNENTYEMLINFADNNYPNIKFYVNKINTDSISVVQDTLICIELINEEIDPVFKTEITIYKSEKYYFKVLFSEMQPTPTKVEKTKVADEFFVTEQLDLGPNIIYIYDLELNNIYKWQSF